MPTYNVSFSNTSCDVQMIVAGVSSLKESSARVIARRACPRSNVQQVGATREFTKSTSTPTKQWLLFNINPHKTMVALHSGGCAFQPRIVQGTTITVRRSRAVDNAAFFKSYAILCRSASPLIVHPVLKINPAPQDGFQHCMVSCLKGSGQDPRHRLK